MERIETERLILRGFTEDDYDDLYEFLAQRRADEFEAYPGITHENGREYLWERIGSDEFYAIVLKETGKVIGNVYFGKRDFEAREVGYIVNKRYQCKGYGTEAVRGLLDSEAAKRLHRVYAECNPENYSSWRLLEKLGFVREGHLRKSLFFRRDDSGKPIWEDTLIYGRLMDE